MRLRLLVLLALGLPLVGGAAALAEYSPQMPPEHLACRHASWSAAHACRAEWPSAQGASVLMRITLDRRGAVRSVVVEPSVEGFARCVRQRLGARRFRISTRARTEVVSRYVFPAEPVAR